MRSQQVIQYVGCFIDVKHVLDYICFSAEILLTERLVWEM